MFKWVQIFRKDRHHRPACRWNLLLDQQEENLKAASSENQYSLLSPFKYSKNVLYLISLQVQQGFICYAQNILLSRGSSSSYNIPSGCARQRLQPPMSTSPFFYPNSFSKGLPAAMHHSNQRERKEENNGQDYDTHEKSYFEGFSTPMFY